MKMPLVNVHGPDDVRIDQVDIPEPGDDDVLVKVSLCGICGSDLGYIRMGGLGGTQPMPLGHELVGTVAALGENVGSLSAGDRVVINPMANANAIGNGGPEGGFAPFLQVRGVARDPRALLKVPDTLPSEHAALVEPLSVALHGCHKGQAKQGDRVVVFGAGPIGLSAIVALRYLGVSDIVAVDLSEFRLSIARQLGATTIQAQTDLAAALMEHQGRTDLMGMSVPNTDLYLETTGAGPVFEQITSLAKTGARVVVLGLHKAPVSFDLVNLLMRELVVTGSMAYDNEFSDVISMLSRGDIDVSPLISHCLPLSKFTEALALAGDISTAAKVLIDCQQ
ncbi:threonine dehydrogenase-like Zn-dependent dehydrogenase [Litorivivens lipolytica]|uniref:Threonine dehydrogenase-like Zn-dependent dehydrogenase n=1 Tax=Litorivivens lipolytica TaxID=1524264 RepID=A0A7W4W6B4_9GAMM|nr:zinc-binding dehydrogenase [Litorivivens lipolytica]MBB3048262.1 threonine dehydrogenase-like Zn-dependent dehydrogenase [Litorivivens lipolytica]